MRLVFMAQIAYLCAGQAILCYKHDILVANALALLAVLYIYRIRKAVTP